MSFKTTKSVLSVTNNAVQFLNGLTSNTMDAPDNAFLTIHGRIVATFDQIQINEDQMLLCIEADFVDQVLVHIDKYVKLSGAKVNKEELNVYFDLDNTVSLAEGDHTIIQSKGKLIITKRELEVNVSDEEFTLFRLQNNIPLHGVDYTDEMLLNVSTERFVSFTKGCFLGQEPISKVYNRSKPTWQLRVKYEDECTDEEKAKMTSKVLDDSNRHLGFVFVKGLV